MARLPPGLCARSVVCVCGVIASVDSAVAADIENPMPSSNPSRSNKAGFCAFCGCETCVGSGCCTSCVEDWREEGLWSRPVDWVARKIASSSEASSVDESLSSSWEWIMGGVLFLC